jgi:ABC-type thiamine transport system ATPase subunit
MALVDQLLTAWREAGVTVLLTSHAPERLAVTIDGSVVLDRGVVAQTRGHGVSELPSALDAPSATRPQQVVS